MSLGMQEVQLGPSRVEDEKPELTWWRGCTPLDRTAHHRPGCRSVADHQDPGFFRTCMVSHPLLGGTHMVVRIDDARLTATARRR